MRQPSPNKVTFPYGATSYPYSAGNPHAGTDYSFRLNPYAYAPEKMRITFTGTLGTCGTAINATGQSGRKYRYCHLGSVFVKAGQTVAEGTKVGRIGATGYVFGAHLHFVMWVNGQRVNPFTTIDKIIAASRPKYPRAVTVTSTAYVRSKPSTSAPLAGSRVLSKGNVFTSVGLVAGTSVGGNNRWHKSSLGRYVWSGNTNVRS